MYDQRDTNGTELRAVAGNFLFSTGANEFAGRYTAGHFDMPVMRTTIAVDDTVVVQDGVLQDVFGLSAGWTHPVAASARSVKSLDSATVSLRDGRLRASPGDELIRAPAARSARDGRAARRTPSAARAVGLDVEALVVEEALRRSSARCGPRAMLRSTISGAA